MKPLRVVVESCIMIQVLSSAHQQCVVSGFQISPKSTSLSVSSCAPDPDDNFFSLSYRVRILLYINRVSSTSLSDLLSCPLHSTSLIRISLWSPIFLFQKWDVQTTTPPCHLLASGTRQSTSTSFQDAHRNLHALALFLFLLLFNLRLNFGFCWGLFKWKVC